jgi:SAM-dependent methyltransferase
VTIITETLEQTAEFWKGFYSNRSLRHTPSPFAQWCLENYLFENSQILELGCGNGRDSFAFLHLDFPVIALDACEVAIADNVQYQQSLSLKTQGEFLTFDFAKLDTLKIQNINTLYSRFVLHAIPESLEDKILDFASEKLLSGAKMLHEFRTIRDPLMQQGEVLSETERLTTHYRRFLNPDVFREKLTARGWNELFFVESDELAVFGEENPVVARIVAEKI